MSAPSPVVFIGAGPGDPGLLTLRGQRVLAEAEVVVVDADVPLAVLESVAARTERVSVGDDPMSVSRSAVPTLLVARATDGLRVARVVAGDGGDVAAEAAAVVGAGVAVEVVPGVGGAVASALYAGIPLVTPDACASTLILDTTAPGRLDWRRLGRGAETLLIRVGDATIEAVIGGLLGAGRRVDAPAALVSDGGTLRQRVVSGRLDALLGEARRQGVAYPAWLVAGDAVGWRARLLWLERRPLYGRRVLVTRPRSQAARFGALLEAYGAEVVAVPTIRLEPPDDWRPLDEAIARLTAFRWVIFTSANGVAAFRERLTRAGRDARALAGAGLAAIGPETAEALRRGGLEPEVVPPEYRAEGLVETLRPYVEAGSEVLLVRAAEAREVLPRALQALGGRVTDAPAYRTVPAKEGADHVVELLEARAVDVVTFTSSSTVRGFMALLAPDEVRRLLAGVVLAAIGPVTAATVAEYGLEVAVIPREYTVGALAEAIAARFADSD